MPLPIGSDKTPWPPTEISALLLKMAQWGAWYTGDLQKLQAAYGGGDIQDSTGFFASDHGGFKATIGRTLQRWFVGEPTRGPDRLTKLPIPIGAQMCQASADLLFADPVVVTSSDAATQERLEAMLDDHAHAMYAEAAEGCAALGGVYLRATWDIKAYPDGPFTTIRDADSAIPEFLFGRLQAVTFWTVVERTDERVMRLLERHEIDPFTGNGVIRYALYQGKDDRLGTRVGLSASPVTAAMEANPDLQMGTLIDTKSPGLAVTYVPNQRPNRLWRTHSIGRYLGRSDLDGVEHLMDQLAEVMSAWTRAIRLGKARIFVAKHLLKNGGPGNGQIADLEQEAYTQVESLAGADLSLAEQVQMLEPRVNYEQYRATAEALTEQILQMAGYSMQTFGVGDTGTVRTATEIESRERRSLMTRDRKIREWRPALEEHLRKLLAIDNALFGGKSNPEADIDIEFASNVQETTLALANTALAQFQSQSASRKERVKGLHPDWDDDAVDEEVKALEAEFPDIGALPDPGMDPFGGSSDTARSVVSESQSAPSVRAA
jgi:hypothetical protein